MGDPTARRKRLLGALVLLFALGNAADLAGTRIAQPNLEFEANPVYRMLLGSGIHAGWPVIIAAKLMLVGLAAWASVTAFRLIPRYYPTSPLSASSFIVDVFYQKPISIWRAMVSRPRDWRPMACLVGPALLCSWPYFTYLGYENIAVPKGWPTVPDFRIGALVTDWAVIVIAVLASVGAVMIFWWDYRLGLGSAGQQNLQPLADQSR